MKLVIDIGNSRARAAIFEANEIIWSGQWEQTDQDALGTAIESHQKLTHALLSSVRNKEDVLIAFLGRYGIHAHLLGHQTALPIENRYQSKATLGYDRIAAAVGAWKQFPGRNLLIIDAGTALTIDHLTADGGFSGGNISPGLRMRFRALHTFTGGLPLVEPGEEESLLGADTRSAIRSGVQEGIIFELAGYINAMKQRYSDLQVVMTGGDAPFFANKLKNTIFVDLNLNLKGLLSILEYNVEE